MPDVARPYRAPRGTILLGVIAASIWLVAAILGFQQFGLPHGRLRACALAYSGAVLYAWRVIEDRRRSGLPAITQTLHVKLTGAMLVLTLNGIAYLVAVNTISATHHPELVSMLANIFTAVALLTISVGLVLPGMITYSATEVSKAAKRLTSGTLRQFSQAMAARGGLSGRLARSSSPGSAATNLSFYLRRASSPSRRRFWPSACSRRSMKTSIAASRKFPSG
jgi:hypothetical protein